MGIYFPYFIFKIILTGETAATLQASANLQPPDVSPMSGEKQKLKISMDFAQQRLVRPLKAARLNDPLLLQKRKAPLPGLYTFYQLMWLCFSTFAFVAFVLAWFGTRLGAGLFAFFLVLFFVAIVGIRDCADHEHGSSCQYEYLFHIEFVINN
jgi:hypothetical protein